uniref:Uncharacterized protein n=1 Tax=Vitis vinifera TaxID=29760 RepID=F6GZ07_VITVI
MVVHCPRYDYGKVDLGCDRC